MSQMRLQKESEELKKSRLETKSIESIKVGRRGENSTANEGSTNIVYGSIYTLYICCHYDLYELC